MKILHVIPYFAPAWGYGGTPRAAFEIAKNQVKYGHQVCVLTTDAFDEKSRLKKFEVIDGIKVFRAKNLSNFLTWKFHFVTPVNLPEEVNSNFDVIHLHEVRSLLNILVLLKFKAKKIVLSPWGTLPYNNSLVLIKKVVDFLFLPILRWKVDFSFAQTTHEEKVLKQFKISKFQIIVPLGIDANFFSSLPSKLESRKKLKIDSNELLFVYLGRFSRYKGVDNLIHVFCQAIEKGIEAKLLLVGRDDGFLSQIINTIKNKKIKDRVIVSGPLYEKDRLYAYQAADWFISLPTVYEETSTTCLEALACGVPVITNKFAQIPFMTIEDGVWHIGDKMVDQVNSIILASKKKYKIDQNKVINIFNWQAITKQYLKIYEK